MCRIWLHTLALQTYLFRSIRHTQSHRLVQGLSGNRRYLRIYRNIVSKLKFTFLVIPILLFRLFILLTSFLMIENSRLHSCKRLYVNEKRPPIAVQLRTHYRRSCYTSVLLTYSVLHDIMQLYY